MKLDPIFTAKNNELYKISDNSKVDLSDVKEINGSSLVYTNNFICKISIPWSKVELEDELYNEEFLANLRDYLKILDDKNQFAIIKPVIDKSLENQDQLELFINAFNHTARRVKDCVSVAGMELPSELLAKGFSDDSPVVQFIEKLAVKHAQYVYFADKNFVSEQKISTPDTIILL